MEKRVWDNSLRHFHVIRDDYWEFDVAWTRYSVQSIIQMSHRSRFLHLHYAFFEGSQTTLFVFSCTMHKQECSGGNGDCKDADDDDENGQFIAPAAHRFGL